MGARTKPHIEVVAGILIERGRVLLGQRKAGTHLAYYWEFPGGKIEAGESAYAALRRELKEEIGIIVSRAYLLKALSYEYCERIVNISFWRVQKYSQEVVAAEQQPLFWAPLEQLKDINLLAANRSIIKSLQ